MTLPRFRFIRVSKKPRSICFIVILLWFFGVPFGSRLFSLSHSRKFGKKFPKMFEEIKRWSFRIRVKAVAPSAMKRFGGGAETDTRRLRIGSGAAGTAATTPDLNLRDRIHTQ